MIEFGDIHPVVLTISRLTTLMDRCYEKTSFSFMILIKIVLFLLSATA